MLDIPSFFILTRVREINNNAICQFYKTIEIETSSKSEHSFDWIRSKTQILFLVFSPIEPYAVASTISNIRHNHTVV